MMLDNHKWRLECRKCERVKAKRFNYNAHAHSSGDRGKSDTLQFDPRPRFQDWNRFTSRSFRFQIVL